MRCEAFYSRAKEFLKTEDFEGLEDFCKKEAKETVFRIRKYIEFHDTYMPSVPIGTVSERALRPVIESGDPDIAAKVVEKIKPLLTPKKGKKKLKVTSETVKKVLAEVQGKPYLTPTERKEIGSDTRLKQTEATCDEFLSMDPGEQQSLLKDLRAIIDLLGTWGARAGPNLRGRISPVRDQVNALRNELILFLPGEAEEVNVA